MSGERVAPSTLRAPLLAWFDVHQREMPWRSDPKPWHVWVSEIMLQQTRVDSVIGYYHRFLARFPTPTHLAEAPADDVMKLWAGLGYYARARNLQKGAQQVVERHGGEVPDDPDAFLALAGVGRYTCGAVQSIAFGRRLPVLDGNVIRVLSRVDLVTSDPREKTTNAALWARAGALADGERPGDLNQALMELGALVCTPRNPKCTTCPLASSCMAYREGDPSRLPVKAKKKPRPRLKYQGGLVRDGSGRIWLGKRPAKGLLGGLWSLPMIQAEGPASLDTLGLTAVESSTPVATVEHGFTHQIWEVSLHACVGQPSGEPFVDWQAFEEQALAEIALAGPSLKALRAAGVSLPHRRGAGRRK